MRTIVSTDGTSLSGSSKSQLWPILGRLADYPSNPFEIAVYNGSAKPSNFNEFLARFTEEAHHLTTNGFTFRGKKLSFEILCFTGDSLALSTLLKLHTAYHSCMTCETEGVYIFNTDRRGGRMTFPELDSPLRTDASFRNQTQQQHHNGKSILETLPISMAYNFVIDVMHLVFIGVMRKLLHVWLNCRRAIKVHLLKATITAVSNNLDQIKNCIPSDFARKTRNLSELPRYTFI